MTAMMVTLAVSAVLLLGLVAGQDMLSHNEKTNFDATVQQLMRCTNISALTLSLVSIDKRVNYVNGYGYRDNQNRYPVGFRNVFCIGGGTQAFTAVLLAILIDKHENITWDTPIQDIVGHRVGLPDAYLSENLNLKDILAMRSGLAGMDIVPVVKPYPADKLAVNLRYAPRVGNFRDHFIYNEALFSLLAEVFKVLGNDTWQNLIRQYILEPLNMKATTFIGTGNTDFIKGTEFYSSKQYLLDDSAYSGLELVAPAASLCTTAEDMSMWLQFILAGGQRGNMKLIRTEALEMTYAAIQPRGQDDDPVIQGYRDIPVPYTRDYNSLGWINGYYRGSSFVSQDGSLPGYQSLTTIIPSSKIGVFVAFSGDKHDKRFLAKVLLNIAGIDLLHQGSPWITQHNICDQIQKHYKERRPSSKDDRFRNVVRTFYPGHRALADYVGLYRNYPYGDVDVKHNESGDNSLTLKYGMALYKLEPTNQNDTFQLIAQGGNLWYSTNTDWYRDNQRLLALFSFDSRDPDQRINSVFIDGLDKNYVPEFGRNAQPPPYDIYYENRRCSSTSLKPWQLVVLVVTALSYFRFSTF